MKNFTHAELQDAMTRVLTRYIELGKWNWARPISELRDGLRFIDPLVIHDTHLPVELTDALCSLPDDEFARLVDQLDLASRFPDAPP